MSRSIDPRARAIVAWYDHNARRLPWRETVSPYRTLVSEIMLQQTRVEAVKPYFERFIAALPTVKALAEVDEQTLLKLWQGLGYYSRARNLKRCAEAVCSEHGGVIPSDPDRLIALPGIGRYTAGAIAAFAYGVDAVAVDGNVLRVAARLFNDSRDILDARTKADFEHRLEEILPSGLADRFGQGLIELGALVCLPKVRPKCEICPLAPYCEARAAGTETTLPNRRSKAKRRREVKTVLLVRSADAVLIRRRPARGLLAGLYEPPSLDGEVGEGEALAFLRALGLEPLRIESAGAARHIFTHVEWQMTAYAVSIAEPETPPDAPYLLVSPRELAERYPLPSAYSAYLSP